MVATGSWCQTGCTSSEERDFNSLPFCKQAAPQQGYYPLLVQKQCLHVRTNHGGSEFLQIHFPPALTWPWNPSSLPPTWPLLAFDCLVVHTDYWRVEYKHFAATPCSFLHYVSFDGGLAVGLAGIHYRMTVTPTHCSDPMLSPQDWVLMHYLELQPRQHMLYCVQNSWTRIPAITNSVKTRVNRLPCHTCCEGQEIVQATPFVLQVLFHHDSHHQFPFIKKNINTLCICIIFVL